ncbi:MAG: hypothetical protein ACYDHP_03205 [Ferrimicrobium sp.]
MRAETTSVWGNPGAVSHGAQVWRVAWRYLLVALVVAVIIGLVVDGLWSVVDGGVVVIPGVVVGVALGLAASVSLLISSFFRLGVHVRALEPSPVARARCESMVERVGLQLGVTDASFRIVDSHAVNAVVLPRGRGRVELLVTVGAVENLALLQFEALVARELATVRIGALRFRAPLARIDQLLGRAFGERSRWLPWQREEAGVLDGAALALTRYPPGLASLLGRAVADGERAAGIAGVPSWMWLYPTGVPQARLDIELRAQYLLDEMWAVAPQK